MMLRQTFTNVTAVSQWQTALGMAGNLLTRRRTNSNTAWRERGLQLVKWKEITIAKGLPDGGQFLPAFLNPPVKR
jgi:hypothetical protein